ncbi:MAG: tRNA glutamyl-Q(34) synthetase GluQRS [Polyangiaceae bacterium]|nr:tRNA glutamyl-Q(34) synthetase GluQRS [Polyangiaceae bacterium]
MPIGYRGRFAPSPTGQLHLGSAAAAIFCAAAALQAHGTLVLRMEDLDTDRVVPGCADAILNDLRWLGIHWQEGPDTTGPFAPYTQSQRLPLYQAALDLLAAQNLTFYCDCSRAEIARAASAPHAGEEGPRYPGTCRPFGMTQRAFKRPPAVRLAVPNNSHSLITIRDRILGDFTENVFQTTGDFVLRRGDGVFAYQLAVVVDDLTMGITEVVRGADLAASAPRQTLLAQLLGGTSPTFAHIPLLYGDNGERLAKRAKGVPLADQRASGVHPSKLLLAIAGAYGVDISPWVDPSTHSHLPTAQTLLTHLAGQISWPQLNQRPVNAPNVFQLLHKFT